MAAVQKKVVELDANWTDHLKSLGTDALGKPYPGTPFPGTTYQTHAHHIILKRGVSEEGKKAADAARNILRQYGIDPIKGRENLVWAPNWGHPSQMSVDSLVELDKVVAKGGKPEQVRKRIVELLTKLATDYNTGRWRPK